MLFFDNKCVKSKPVITRFLLLCLIILSGILLFGCGQGQKERGSGETARGEIKVKTEEIDDPIISELTKAPSSRPTQATTHSPTSTPTPKPTPEPSEDPKPSESALPSGVIKPTEDAKEKITYVANMNTKKFHKPSCSSVKEIKESNRWDFTGERQDLINKGYVPCKRCNP